MRKYFQTTVFENKNPHMLKYFQNTVISIFNQKIDKKKVYKIQYNLFKSL